jgi:hypothetical protein
MCWPAKLRPGLNLRGFDPLTLLHTVSPNGDDMVEINDKELEHLAMVIRSLQEGKKSNFELYRTHIPLAILEKAKTVKTIEEYMNDNSILTGDLKSIIRLLEKARRSIKYTSPSGGRYGGRRYGRPTGYQTKIQHSGDFRLTWDKIVKANRHMEALDFMATRSKKGKPPEFQIQGCVGELMVNCIIQRGKIDDQFITFITEGKGVKYFNVPAKKKIVNYLHANKRLDDMYRFSGAGSKTINDMVIRLADINDLPFLMNTEGDTAKRRLEKRIDKVK